MKMVLLTALGVGGATIIGSLLGFLFKNISHKFTDIILSFAAGVMLSAAVLGLILPSLEYGGNYAILITVAGIFSGALCLNLIDKLVPHLHKLVGSDIESHNNANLNKVLLFVLAIAIHNLPEGIAAGVSFGTDDVSQALMIAGGIALQNIPEGMVIIGPMLAAGVSPYKTFILIQYIQCFSKFYQLSAFHNSNKIHLSLNLILNMTCHKDGCLFFCNNFLQYLKIINTKYRVHASRCFIN